MIAFALALMFWQVRAAAAAQLLAIPPVGWAMWALLVRLFRRGWLGRIGALLGLAGLGGAACAYQLYPIANGAIANLTADNNAANKAAPKGPVAAGSGNAAGKKGPAPATASRNRASPTPATAAAPSPPCSRLTSCRPH